MSASTQPEELFVIPDNLDDATKENLLMQLITQTEDILFTINSALESEIGGLSFITGSLNVAHGQLKQAEKLIQFKPQQESKS